VDEAMSHAEYEQLAAGYVLGALEPDDEHLFQRHLEGCAICESSVRELEEVAGALAYAVPPVEPPATLRASIRRRVGATARPRGVVSFRPGGAVSLRPRTRLTLVSRIAVAAGILALFALGFWNMSLRNQNSLYQQRVAALEQVGRLVSDPSTQMVRLDGDPVERGARVVVLASSLQDKGALIVEGLAAPPSGKVYELWGIPNGQGLDKAMPATVFRTSGKGVQQLFFELSIQPNMIYGVTEEPGPNGSQKPTTTPILVGSSSTTRA
jgi:hypothetical protein